LNSTRQSRPSISNALTIPIAQLAEVVRSLMALFFYMMDRM
jgi:hypothetical protein